jgi:amino acid transporter
MESMADILVTLLTQFQRLLVGFTSVGVALESNLSAFLPFDYPPQFRFFLTPELIPFSLIHLIASAYELLALVTIALLVLFLRYHSYYSSFGRKGMSWVRIVPRGVVVLGVFWGMLVSVSRILVVTP